MFDFFRREKKPNPDASRLLASILVVYPTIQSVTYDSNSDMLELSFALNGKFSQDDFEDFLSHVAESVETFHHIEGLGGAKIELDVEGVYGTCFLNVRRDMSTLTCRELSLLTSLHKIILAKISLKNVKAKCRTKNISWRRKIIWNSV